MSLRSENEIQRAHDILVAVRLGEVPIGIDVESLITLCGALDALCWVLGHEYNTAFGANLQQLDECARAVGFVLRGAEAELTAPLFDRNLAGFCPACGVNRKAGEEHSKACALFPRKPVRSRRLPWPPEESRTDKGSTDGNPK